jgi:hypothetical protein
MTTLLKRVVRETSSQFRGDPIVVKLQPKAIFLRTKGSRHSYGIPYADLYDIAAMCYAKQVTDFTGKPRNRRRS